MCRSVPFRPAHLSRHEPERVFSFRISSLRHFSWIRNYWSPFQQQLLVFHFYRLVPAPCGIGLGKVEPLVRSSSLSPVQRRGDNSLRSCQHCFQFQPILQIEIKMLLDGQGERKQFAFHLLNTSKGLLQRVAGSKRARALPHQILQLRLKRDGWKPIGIAKAADSLRGFDERLCVPAFPSATDFTDMIGGMAAGGLSEDESLGDGIAG